MSESRKREPLDAAMVRLADGDRDAIPTVYRALWPVLVRFCRSFVGDRADAEDLAQNTLVKLFEQAHAYDPSRSAQAWALSIAAWECRTLRKSQTRNAHNVQKMRRVLPNDAPPDVEAEAWKRQALTALHQLIATMPPADRNALIDSFEKELSEPIHRKRKQRVLGRLRRRWRELYGED